MGTAKKDRAPTNDHKSTIIPLTNNKEVIRETTSSKDVEIDQVSVDDHVSEVVPTFVNEAIVEEIREKTLRVKVTMIVANR